MQINACLGILPTKSTQIQVKAWLLLMPIVMILLLLSLLLLYFLFTYHHYSLCGTCCCNTIISNRAIAKSIASWLGLVRSRSPGTACLGDDNDVVAVDFAVAVLVVAAAVEGAVIAAVAAVAFAVVAAVAVACVAAADVATVISCCCRSQ